MEDVSESARLIRTSTRPTTKAAGYTTFRDGDVLFAKITPCMENGKGALVDGLHGGFGFGSTEFHVLRARPHTDARFIAQWCQATRLRKRAEAMMTGSAGQRRVPSQFFDHFRVPAFSLAEQRRIAEILDSVDGSIRSTEHLIDKVRNVKSALVQDFLSRWTSESRKFEQYSANGHFRKDADTLKVRGSKFSTVADVASPAPGSTVIGPFGSNLTARDYRSSGAPVVFVRDIRPDAFKWVSNVWLSSGKFRELAPHVVIPGDVVATKMGLPPGVAAVYPEDMPDGIITADVIRIRPNPEVVRSRWLSLILNSDLVGRQVGAITGGVTRPKITLRDYRQISLPTPPLDVQDFIISALDSHDNQTHRLVEELDKLRSLKKGLMEDLLTGRVRVTAEGA
ncbi:restriction endonuclease subunit S [Micromonospora sp. WMMD1219]|uniref:restriction endonuclease subunit S n=1 Tax=Micromonospora sp. WMMD1219 TaxID=3404115 RepID=UPI003BF4BD4B